MKKILPFVVAALISLAPIGIASATESVPACPTLAVKCFAKDADYFCTWNQEVLTNKLVRGRAGQLEYQRLPSSRVVTHKCTVAEHPAGKF